MTAGGAAWQSDVTVAADPRFQISEVDRAARFASLMSAYQLQQRLVDAREAAMTLSARSSGKPWAASLAPLRTQISNALAAAGRAQAAIDSYDGLPTAAQLRELDWAWSDGVTAVTALNHLIEQDAAGLVKTVPLPTR